MSKLPEELADLAELERLDISHNAYIALPHVVYKMPKLLHLQAQNNHIVGMYQQMSPQGFYFVIKCSNMSLNNFQPFKSRSLINLEREPSSFLL
jgi:hypothetical protein